MSSLLCNISAVQHFNAALLPADDHALYTCMQAGRPAAVVHIYVCAMHMDITDMYACTAVPSANALALQWSSGSCASVCFIANSPAKQVIVTSV